MVGINTTLYDFSADMVELERIAEEEGTVDQEKYATVFSLIQKKVDSICGFVRSRNDRIDAIDKRIKQLTELKKRITKDSHKFDKYVKMCMKYMDTSTLQGTLDRIKIRKPTKKVFIISESSIPEEYLNTKKIVTPNKKAILEALKTDQQIGWAKLVDGETNVNYGV